jgi:hypothetical protein
MEEGDRHPQVVRIPLNNFVFMYLPYFILTFNLGSRS